MCLHVSDLQSKYSEFEVHSKTEGWRTCNVPYRCSSFACFLLLLWLDFWPNLELMKESPQEMSLFPRQNRPAARDCMGTFSQRRHILRSILGDNRKASRTKVKPFFDLAMWKKRDNLKDLLELLWGLVFHCVSNNEQHSVGNCCFSVNLLQHYALQPVLGNNCTLFLLVGVFVQLHESQIFQALSMRVERCGCS